MKKLIYIVVIGLSILFMGSCKRPNAEKETKNVVDKLEYFNKTFKKYYEDRVISSKEYSELKDIANGYYEMMNKINMNIQEERKDAKEGKEIFNYEDKYKKSLSDLDQRIKEQTAIFEKNIRILAQSKK